MLAQASEIKHEIKVFLRPFEGLCFRFPLDKSLSQRDFLCDSTSSVCQLAVVALLVPSCVDKFGVSCLTTCNTLEEDIKVALTPPTQNNVTCYNLYCYNLFVSLLRVYTSASLHFPTPHPPPTCGLLCFPGLWISYSAISCATLEYDFTSSLSIPNTIFFVNKGFDSFSRFFPAVSLSFSLLPVNEF